MNFRFAGLQTIRTTRQLGKPTGWKRRSQLKVVIMTRLDHHRWRPALLVAAPQRRLPLYLVEINSPLSLSWHIVLVALDQIVHNRFHRILKSVNRVEFNPRTLPLLTILRWFR